jgi:hypothetical protein
MTPTKQFVIQIKKKRFGTFGHIATGSILAKNHDIGPPLYLSLASKVSIPMKIQVQN